MANTKVYANGTGVTFWWAPENGIVNPAKPTLTEMNNALNVTEVVSTDSFGLGVQASNQNSDPSYADVGNTQARGFSQFGGAVSFFYPSDYELDATDVAYLAFDALREPGTSGYFIVRADGEKITGGIADPGKGAVANDLVNTFHVISDGWDDTVEGEVNFKYAINFLPQSDVYINAIVATSATVTTPAPVGAADYTVGGKTTLGSYLTGRQLAAVTNEWSGYPGKFVWSSSDTSVATVDRNGVVIGVAAGTASITAHDPDLNVTSTALSVTIA